MPWPIRVSIAQLMGVAFIAAITCAALRNPTEPWAGTVLLLTCGAVMIAIAGTLCQPSEQRAGWLGFALFGGGYLALVHWMALANKSLPTITLAELVFGNLGLELGRAVDVQGLDRKGWNALRESQGILHCGWSFVFAVLGGLLARIVVGQPRTGAMEPDDTPRSRPRLLRPPGKRPLLIGLAAFWMVAIMAVVRQWPAPGVWAGLSFLLTCGLLGTAALGAAFSRRRDRGVCLGAALFGFGYLALAFGESVLFIVAPHLPTERLVNRLLRPGGPQIASEFPDFTTQGYYRFRDQLIQQKLETIIPFHFPEPTPLEDMLKYVKTATTGPNFTGIPIYVDPVGLDNAECTMQSPVSLDIDAITVKDGLRRCLKQRGLSLVMQPGLVTITDEDNATLPAYKDPVQIVGHSLLALVAAALGAAAVRLVAERPRTLHEASS